MLASIYSLSSLIYGSKNTDSLHLPEEILLKIFSFIKDPNDLLKCARVCRKWRRITNDGSLWRELVDRSPLRQYCLEEFSSFPFDWKRFDKRAYLEFFTPITSQNLKKKSLKKMGQTFCETADKITRVSANSREIAIVINKRNLFLSSFTSDNKSPYTYQDSGTIDKVIIGDDGIIYCLSDKIALRRHDAYRKSTQHFYSKMQISDMELYENQLLFSCNNFLKKTTFGSKEATSMLTTPESVEIDAFTCINRSIFTLLSHPSESDTSEYWFKKFAKGESLEKNQQLICQWDGETSAVLTGVPHDQSKAFSISGSLLASAAYDSCCVWDLRTHTKIINIIKQSRKKGNITQLELHQDLIYEISSDTLSIWNLAYPRTAQTVIRGVRQFVYLSDVLLTAEKSLTVRHLGHEDAKFPWLESYFLTHYCASVLFR